MLGVGLRGAGYQVSDAADGEEALLIAEALRPDLVILDIMMPVKSGWEFLRDVRKIPALKHLKIIVLTAIGAAVGEATSSLAGADAHLDKPFQLTELLKVVEDLIGEPPPVPAS